MFYEKQTLMWLSCADKDAHTVYRCKGDNIMTKSSKITYLNPHHQKRMTLKTRGTGELLMERRERIDFSFICLFLSLLVITGFYACVFVMDEQK